MKRQVITMKSLVLIFSKYINSLKAWGDCSREPPRAWHPSPLKHMLKCSSHLLPGIYSPGTLPPNHREEPQSETCTWSCSPNSHQQSQWQGKAKTRFLGWGQRLPDPLTPGGKIPGRKKKISFLRNPSRSSMLEETQALPTPAIKATRFSPKTYLVVKKFA